MEGRRCALSFSDSSSVYAVAPFFGDLQRRGGVLFICTLISPENDYLVLTFLFFIMQLHVQHCHLFIYLFLLYVSLPPTPLL